MTEAQLALATLIAAGVLVLRGFGVAVRRVWR